MNHARQITASNHIGQTRQLAAMPPAGAAQTSEEVQARAIDARELWHLFAAVNAEFVSRLDRDLQQQFKISLLDYQVMWALLGAQDRRLRMSDLARRVFVSPSRLTYRVDRLAAVGYVRREKCVQDGRGFWAHLAPLGLTVVTNALPGYNANIDEWFSSRISDEELQVLKTVLRRISHDSDLSGGPGAARYRQ